MLINITDLRPSHTPNLVESINQSKSTSKKYETKRKKNKRHNHPIKTRGNDKTQANTGQAHQFLPLAQPEERLLSEMDGSDSASETMR